MLKAFLLLAGLVAVAPVYAQKASSAAATKARWGLFETYCTDCHNATDWAGSVAFDTLSPADLVNDIKLGEHTIRKLRGHLMPPPGNKQPTQAEYDDLVGWLEASLDARKETPRAQHVTAQRLNRTEYANAVRTLLAVDVKVEDVLPPDVELEGFDNIAAALTVSPAFLDQYISAARNIAVRATGQGTPKLIRATYGNQPGGVAPPGANRGMRFKHFFPADGEYRVSILNDLGGANTHAVMFRSTIVMFLDGKEFFRGDVGGKEDLALFDLGASGSAKVMPRFRNIPVKAPYGFHEILVTTVERAQVLSDANTGGGAGANGANPSSVEVAGPYGEIGYSPGQSRDRVFICYAKTEPEEKPCAEKIARHLATQAYRRPATDADVQRLMGFYATGRKDVGNFIGGVQEVVMAVLSSPEFLYRTIQPKDEKQKRPQPLTALELASRLSFFLWSDVPDDELREVAVSGKLSDPAVYEKQVNRMLADKKASALVTSFAMRWLNVDDLDAVKPDAELFRNFERDGLRAAFTTEMKMFLSEVLLENKNVLELLSADYTYVNGTLAGHYGIRGVQGAAFTRVQLTDANRFGLLGKGAVLLRTSYPDRTSPVLRGAWVLEKLLNTMTSPPPPGVETNLNPTEGAKPTTLRGRLEVHRAAKSCKQCHGVIDPIGLAMENFDVTGAYRTRDSGIEVDASTVLPNGTAITGVSGLRESLLARPDQLVQTLVQKLLMYGAGREIEPADMPQVRQIVRDAKAGGYRFFDLTMAVAKSDAFKLQGPPHAEESKKPAPTVAAVQK